MGIVNVTPDSFSDGGRHFSLETAIAGAIEMEKSGADLLDIGGESTRPGATPVSVEEELRRVIPVFNALRGKISIPLSIDTTKAEVARQALKAGASIVNDISGGEWDSGLWPVVAEAQAGYILTHCQGRPATMQQQPTYENLVEEVYSYLSQKILAAERAGISTNRVVCDVGIGFGKTMEQNWQLLRALDRFVSLGRPLLVGLSRKSFLRNLVSPGGLEGATTAAQVMAASNGASLWRVHDVPAAVASARVVESMNSGAA
jgi:dihydropteroate synthase